MSKLVKSTLIILISLVLVFSFMPIKQVSAVEQRAVTSLQSGKVYRIRNKDTGKYLNVNYGKDANGTNVTQFTGDGSIEQKWKAVKNSDGTWKFYAMCSSNGTNRVLDVIRTGGSASGDINNGNNIDIWAPNDSEAQNWTLAYQNNGAFFIWLAASDYHMLIASYGTGNGSGAGTSSTSNGNVFLTDGQYNSNRHPYWEFIEV